MQRLMYVGFVCLAVMGCDSVVGDDKEQEELENRLEVTARSAASLTLRWPSLGAANTYTVDYLTGVARCTDFPQHSDILHVTGTTVNLTGLIPSTRYHIHVHLLPHSTGQSTGHSTSTVFVMTLPPGSAEQPASRSDYESCVTSGN